MTDPDQLPMAPVCAPCADNADGRCCGTGECWLCPLNKIEADSGLPFQRRVEPWMLSCFGAGVSRDRTERSHRFLEEALELVQAASCTPSEAHQLVDYVFGRPAGELAQEVGGVMVTLAALCLAQDVDMHAAGETELARVWTKIDVIRAKHAAKPKHSPLPGATAAGGATLCVAECIAQLDVWSGRLEAAIDRRALDQLGQHANDEPFVVGVSPREKRS